ncbi:MAG: hypothetical protein JNM56_38915 [Planctomycetia bacterium]|nr:hypothetical protein [Planctomycetia bacterium]
MLPLCRWSGCVVALALAAWPLRAAEVGPYLPNQTEAVLVVNVKQLVEAPLLKDHLEPIKQALKQLDVAPQAFKQLGLEPWNDAERIIVAWTGNPDGESPCILLQGNFDNAKIEAAAARIAKEEAKDKNTPVQERFTNGQRVWFLRCAEEPQWLALGLLDQGTLFLSRHPGRVAEAVGKKEGKVKHELRKDLQTLLGRLDAKQSIGVASLSRPLNFAGLLGNLPGNLQNVAGGVTLGDDIRLELALSARDTQTAKAAAGQLEDSLNQLKALTAVLVTQKKQYAPLADLINGLKVTTQGNELAFKATIDRDLLEKVFKKEP